VRFFVYFGIIAAFLFSSFCAASKSAASRNSLKCKSKEQNQFNIAKQPQQYIRTSSAPHHRFIHVARSEKKFRPQHFAAVNSNGSLPIPEFYVGYHIAYTSPLYLPLKRLLLFPNHYFW
jgi:hypothetical protein